MKIYLFSFAFLIFLCGCHSSANRVKHGNPKIKNLLNQFFLNGDESITIGILNKSRIRYFEYSFKNKKWDELTDKLIEFPNDGSELMVLNPHMVGKVKDNKIEFYVDNGYNNWSLSPNYTFTVPKENDGIYPLAWCIGIKKDNIIQVFDNENNGWSVTPKYEFSPDGFIPITYLDNVHIPYYAIVKNDSVTVFSQNLQGKWRGEFGLKLQNSFDDIFFGYYKYFRNDYEERYDPKWYAVVGVVIGNKIKFYLKGPKDDEFKYMNNMDFAVEEI